MSNQYQADCPYCDVSIITYESQAYANELINYHIFLKHADSEAKPLSE